MKVLVVSGFFGAGKSYFIKQLCPEIKGRICVLETARDYVAPDRQLKEPDQALSFAELSDGCICCIAKGKIAAAVLHVASVHNPGYLIVEVAGSTLLSNVMTELRQIEHEGLEILAPLTVVDAATFARDVERSPSVVHDQIGASRTVVLSRRGLMNERECRNISRRLRRRHSVRVISQRSAISQPMLGRLLSDWPGRTSVMMRPEERQWETSVFDVVVFPSTSAMFLFLEAATNGEFGPIARLKGTFQCGRKRFFIDATADRYQLTGSENTPIQDCLSIVGDSLRLAHEKLQRALKQPRQDSV